MPIFAYLLSFLIFSTQVIAEPTVYIYAGPGSTKTCLEQAEHTLESMLKPYYRIERIYAEQILNDPWEKNAALLVIAGGEDIPYAKALNGIGNQKIRSYVENGGSFLGICAGAYYAGDFVEFAKGTELEVLGERELAFFPGTVRGPNLAPYVYRSERGALAAHILWKDALKFPQDTPFTVYYNGGGYFVDAESKNNVHVLATYDTPDRPAAIVECEIGSGKAILSSVHFEFDPALFDPKDPYLEAIKAEMSENQNRLNLVQHLLERLL